MQKKPPRNLEGFFVGIFAAVDALLFMERYRQSGPVG